MELLASSLLVALGAIAAIHAAPSIFAALIAIVKGISLLLLALLMLGVVWLAEES